MMPNKPLQPMLKVSLRLNGDVSLHEDRRGSRAI